MRAPLTIFERPLYRPEPPGLTPEQRVQTIALQHMVDRFGRVPSDFELRLERERALLRGDQQTAAYARAAIGAPRP